jgi:hypothetical protein
VKVHLDCKLPSRHTQLPARSSICLPSLRSALTAAAFSEAERIVFAAEGLFLAHDFPFYCGLKVNSISPALWFLLRLCLVIWTVANLG